VQKENSDKGINGLTVCVNGYLKVAKFLIEPEGCWHSRKDGQRWWSEGGDAMDGINGVFAGQGRAAAVITVCSMKELIENKY
jgi:hypothetical protein